MPSEYFFTLDYESQKRYLQKLVIDSETLPDSYGIAQDLRLTTLQCGPTRSSEIYTPPTWSIRRVPLRKISWRPTSNYNVVCGNVRTVYYCRTSNSNRLAILKACVNRSQNTAAGTVVFCKETGCVKAARCRSMAVWVTRARRSV